MGMFAALSVCEAGWATLASTAAGGALVAFLGWPASWLIGAMLAVSIAAFVFFGISMGSTATPEGVAAMWAWPGNVALLCVSGFATLLGGLYLRACPRLGSGDGALCGHDRGVLLCGRSFPQ